MQRLLPTPGAQMFELHMTGVTLTSAAQPGVFFRSSQQPVLRFEFLARSLKLYCFKLEHKP